MDYLNAIKSLKLQVMRAEIWKYIILYLNGGIFAEIDVFPLKSLQNWDHYPFETYQVIIGVFDNEYFSNKIFMSAPHHPLFKHIIESIYEKIKTEGMDSEEIV